MCVYRVTRDSCPDISLKILVSSTYRAFEVEEEKKETIRLVWANQTIWVDTNDSNMAAVVHLSFNGRSSRSFLINFEGVLF